MVYDSLCYERINSLLFAQRETSPNITAEEAYSYCNTSLSNIPAINFTDILSRDDIDAKINECAFDVEVLFSLAIVYYQMCFISAPLL